MATRDELTAELLNSLGQEEVREPAARKRLSMKRPEEFKGLSRKELSDLEDEFAKQIFGKDFKKKHIARLKTARTLREKAAGISPKKDILAFELLESLRDVALDPELRQSPEALIDLIGGDIEAQEIARVSGQRAPRAVASQFLKDQPADALDTLFQLTKTAGRSANTITDLINAQTKKEIGLGKVKTAAQRALDRKIKDTRKRIADRQKENRRFGPKRKQERSDALKRRIMAILKARHANGEITTEQLRKIFTQRTKDL